MRFVTEYGIDREVATFTPEQIAQLRPLVLAACLAEAGGDEDAATAASDIIMSMGEEDICHVVERQLQAERERMQRTLAVLTEGLVRMQPMRSAALSLLDGNSGVTR